MKVVIIDNYDSFTYNLVQILGELGAEVEVIRNDQVDVGALEARQPDGIVISPGPGRPEKAGITLDVIRHFAGKTPLLGVCLGHQAIAQAFGGRLVTARELRHGKVSLIHHNGDTILRDLPTPFEATRYHSLVVERESLPEELEVTAWTEEGTIMALRHRDHPLFGLQFHPESVMTAEGRHILQNFLAELDPEGPAASRFEGAGRLSILKEATAHVFAGKNLTEEEAAQCLELILSGTSDPSIASFLTALAKKGETAQEIAGFARVMRRHAVRIHSRHPKVIDTAGTGGGVDTFNISTAAAFVIAGAGLPVAKHGNRAVTSRSGSADVLAALGVAIDRPPEVAERCLDEVGMAFMFAPLFHPAMKKVAGLRPEVGHRTIFNILGPLTNPAGAPYQIIGVYSAELLQKMAQALALLGCRRAWIVHSEDGLDELSTGSRVRVADVRSTRVRNFFLDPARLGFRVSRVDTIPGDTPEKNARLITGILEGWLKGPARDVVVLNAAAALHLAGEGEWAETIGKAEESIDSGAARDKLKQLVEASRS